MERNKKEEIHFILLEYYITMSTDKMPTMPTMVGGNSEIQKMLGLQPSTGGRRRRKGSRKGSRKGGKRTKRRRSSRRKH